MTLNAEMLLLRQPISLKNNVANVDDSLMSLKAEVQLLRQLISWKDNAAKVNDPLRRNL